MKTPKELMEEIDKRTWTTKVKILEAIRQRDAEWETEVKEIIAECKTFSLKGYVKSFDWTLLERQFSKLSSGRDRERDKI